MHPQWQVKLGCDQEITHGRELLVLGCGHGSDHALHVGESGRAKIVSHDLSDSPRGALQRCGSIQLDGSVEPVILMRARGAIPPGGWVADVAVIKLPSG